MRSKSKARAYPLQILVWHEIVNDEIKGTPVAITFCPLCYSALAFDRRLDGQTLRFGVSGLRGRLRLELDQSIQRERDFSSRSSECLWAWARIGVIRSD